MPENTFDIVIVGAGPAGSSAAIACARLGLGVLVLERARLPRDKVCGCCLSASAVGALGSLGAGDVLDARGAIARRRLDLRLGETRAEIALRGGRILSRTALDLALVERARVEGARVLEGARALAIHEDSSTAHVEYRADGITRVARARVVLVADGLAGSVLHGRSDLAWRASAGSLMGVGTRLGAGLISIERGSILMCVGSSGYVGLVRLEDGTIDVAGAIDPRAVRASLDRGGIGSIVRTIVHGCGVDASAIGDTRFQGTPTLTRRRARLGARRVLVLGDAASYVEPFTGEGIGWALACGVGVAPIAREGARAWREGLVGVWEREHRRMIGRRTRVCRAMAGVLRHPVLSAGMLALAGRVPEIGDRMAAWIGRPIVGSAGEFA